MSKKLRILFLFFLTIGSASLFGCAGATPVTESPTQTQPPSENTPDPEPASLSEPTAEVNYCLDCHTSKEKLIKTAKPEEEVISENEGTG
jgi:hypothetical protein